MTGWMNPFIFTASAGHPMDRLPWMKAGAAATPALSAGAHSSAQQRTAHLDPIEPALRSFLETLPREACSDPPEATGNSDDLPHPVIGQHLMI